MVTDWIYALFEQSFKRQEAESKITDEMIPLTSRLIKILKWEDSVNNKRHAKAIRSSERMIFGYVMLSSTKFKKGQLHRIICEEPLKLFANTIHRLRVQYDSEYKGKLKAYRTDEEVEELLEMILSVYAFKLSEAKSNPKIIVDLEDIITKNFKIYIHGLNN